VAVGTPKRERSRKPPLNKAERQLERERRKNRDKLTRRIERLEGEIQGREKELEAIEWRLGDPQVYSDPERVSAVTAEQAELREATDALYAEWERLSDELAALDDLLA
jgi:ATP-binding cassette subfamily F protein 3